LPSGTSGAPARLSCEAATATGGKTVLAGPVLAGPVPRAAQRDWGRLYRRPAQPPPSATQGPENYAKVAITARKL